MTTRRGLLQLKDRPVYERGFRAGYEAGLKDAQRHVVEGVDITGWVKCPVPGCRVYEDPEGVTGHPHGLGGAL